MPYFYVTQNGETRQVEADYYERTAGNSGSFSYVLDSTTGPISIQAPGNIVSISDVRTRWNPFGRRNGSGDLNLYSAIFPIDGANVFYQYDSAYGDNFGVLEYLVFWNSAAQRLCTNGAGCIDYPPDAGIEPDVRNPDCSDCCRSLLPIIRGINI